MDYERIGVRMVPVFTKAGLGRKAVEFATSPAIVRQLRQRLKPPTKWTNGPVSAEEAAAVQHMLSVFPLAENVVRVLTDPVHLGEVRAIMYAPQGHAQL